MKYRNKKTGAVIDVKSKISGGGWEPVKKQKEKKNDDTGGSAGGSAGKDEQ